jgi:hypothetical protein
VPVAVTEAEGVLDNPDDERDKLDLYERACER